MPNSDSMVVRNSSGSFMNERIYKCHLSGDANIFISERGILNRTCCCEGENCVHAMGQRLNIIF